MENFKKSSHVVLTSHYKQVFKKSIEVKWGVKDPLERGPIVGTISQKENRNAIGTHSGSYTVYRALSIASGQYERDHIPDLKNTDMTTEVGLSKDILLSTLRETFYEHVFARKTNPDDLISYEFPQLKKIVKPKVKPIFTNGGNSTSSEKKSQLVK